MQAPSGGPSLPTDDAGRVTFTNVMSGRFCVAPGGTHVRTPTSSDECWSLTTAGSHVLKVLENADDALRLIKNDDGRDYLVEGKTQKRGLAMEEVFAPVKGLLRRGFDLGGDCADATAPAFELGDIGWNYSFPDNVHPPAGWSVPQGYDFVIVGPAPGSFGGSTMTLPASSSKSLQEDRDIYVYAAEALRSFGIYGDYGGYEEAVKKCAYTVFYGTRALNNGAPRQ